MSNSQQGPPRRSLLDTVAALAREQQQQKLQAQQQRSLTAGLAAPLVNPSPTPPSVQSAQASLSAPAQGGSGSGPLPTLAQRPLVGLTGLDLSSGHSEPPGPSLSSRLLRPSTSGSIGSPSTSLLGTGKRKLQGVLDLGSASSDLRVSNEGYLGQGAGAPAGLSHEQLLHRQQLALLEARQQQQQQLLQLQGLPASSQRPLPLSLQQQSQQQPALGDPGGAAGPTAPARSALLTTLLLQQQQQQQSLSGTSGRQPSGDRMDLGGAPGSYSPARPRSGGLGVSQQQGWTGASSRQPSGERLDLGAGLGPYGPGSVQLRGVGLAGQQQQGWTGASSRQPSGERLDLGAGPGPYGPGMLLDRRSPVIGEGRMGSQSSLDDAIARSCSVSGASAAHLKSGDLGSTSGALPGLRATLGAGSAQPSPQQRVGLQHSSNDGGLVAAGRGQQGQPLALQDTILAPSLLHGRSHSQGGLSQAQQQLQQLQQYHQQQLLLLQRQQLRLAQEAAEAGPSGPALALDAAGVAGGSMTSSLSGAARSGRPLSSGSVPTADGRPPSGGLGLGAGLGGAPAVQLQRVSDAAVDGRPSSSSSRLFKVCETRAYDEIDLLLQDIDLLHVAQSGWGAVGSTGHQQQQQQQQLQQQLQQQREQEELHGGEGPSKFSRHSEDSGISMRRYHSSPLPTEDKMTGLNLQQQLRVSQAAQQQQQQQALQGSGTQQQQPGLQDPEVYRQRLLALHRHHQEQLQQKQQQQQQLQGGPMAPFAHPHGATAAASEPLDAPRTGLPSGTASSVSSGLQLQQQVGPRAAAVQSEPLPAVGIDRHHPPRYSSFSQRQQQQQLQLQQYQHPDPPHLPYVPYQPYGQQEQQQQQTWKPPDKEAFTAAAAAAAARGEYVEWLSGQQLGMSAGQRGREPSGSGLLAGSGPLQLGMSSGFRSAGNSSKLLGGELASGIGAGISGGLQQQQHQQQSPGFYATEVPSWRSATDAPGVQLPRGVQQGQSGAAAGLPLGASPPPLQQQQQQLQLQPQEALQQQQASLQVQQQALGQPQVHQAGAAYPTGPPGGVEPTPGLNLNGGHVGAERAHDKELVPPMLDPDMCGELFDLPGVSGDDLGGVDELMREILSSNDAMDADAGTPNTQLAPGLGHVQGEGQGQAHGLGQGQGQPQSVVASGPNQTPPPHYAREGQGQGQPQSLVASGANQPPPAKYARYNPNGTQQLQQQEQQQQESGKPPPLQQQQNVQQQQYMQPQLVQQQYMQPQLVQQQHMQPQLVQQEEAPEPGGASASNARSLLGTWAPPAPLLPQRSGNFLVPSPVLQQQQQQHPLPVLQPTRVYPSGSGQSASRLSRQSYGRSSGSMQKSTSGAAGGSSASANVDATAAAGSGTGPRALTPRAVAAVESAGPSGPPGWPVWPHGRVRGMSSGSVGGSGIVGRGGVTGCRPDSGQTTRSISSMGTGTLGTPRGDGDGRTGDVDIEAAGAAANGSGGTPPKGSGGTPASASRGGASTRGSSRGNSGSKPRVYNRTVPTFGDIVSHGLFPVGEAMWTVGNIKDEVAVEITQTGEIVYEGAKYSSISAFALVVLRQRNSDRQACDGWREVRYGGVKMEVLRKECLRIMFENGEL